MGTASYSTISRWFDKGVEQRAQFLIVVHDTFDHDNYPVYCSDVQEFWMKYDEHDNKNMQMIEEVYDLNLEKSIQMCELRAMRLPERI